MIMPVGKPKIEIDVTHSFDNIVVLDHIKFDVYENEFLCILGPSGCGKTTIEWRTRQSPETQHFLCFSSAIVFALADRKRQCENRTGN
jgi:ABC-type transporter Mla maintaining outer membrane lipid asymmetry ATPase subunit MlaF